MINIMICSIFDSVTGSYMAPFVAQNNGHATRMFTDLVLDPASNVSKHPHDYALFQVGEFCDKSGNVTPQGPVCIARAHELLALHRQMEEDRNSKREPQPANVDVLNTEGNTEQFPVDTRPGGAETEEDSRRDVG